MYAVDLDVRGEHIVVGGRDKTVALYEVLMAEGGGDAVAEDDPGALHMALKWEVDAQDFVYTVALSGSMEYVAFGGTAKTAVVVSASTGMTICDVVCSNPHPSSSPSTNPNPKPNSNAGIKIFEVACSGVLWAVALLTTAKETKLCIGGEIPVVKVIDLSSQSDELQLPAPNTTYDIAITPAALSFPDGHTVKMYGAGGLYHSWREQPSIDVVCSMIVSMAGNEEQLLHCIELILARHPAMVNACHPETGVSLISFVVAHTNHPKLLQAMLRANCELGLPVDQQGNSALHVAIRLGKWSSVQLLLDAFRSPRFSVIPGSLAPISDCLPGLAAKYPHDFLQFIATFELQPEPEVLGENDVADVMLPQIILRGSQYRSPRGIWNADLMKTRKTQERLANLDPQTALKMLSMSGSLSETEDSDASIHGGPEVDVSKKVELGFNTGRNSGVQAYRVPFENFAALPSMQTASFLQLVVDASNATQSDYSVFGSRLIELMLDYKWANFARRKYFFDAATHIIRVTLLLIWNQLSSNTANMSLNELLTSLLDGEGESVMLATLWCYTTLSTVLQLRVEVFELCDAGISKFFTDVWNLADVACIICQIAINVLFVLRDYAPTAMAGDFDAALYAEGASSGSMRRSQHEA